MLEDAIPDIMTTPSSSDGNAVMMEDMTEVLMQSGSEWGHVDLYHDDILPPLLETPLPKDLVVKPTTKTDLIQETSTASSTIVNESIPTISSLPNSPTPASSSFKSQATGSYHSKVNGYNNSTTSPAITTTTPTSTTNAKNNSNKRRVTFDTEHFEFIPNARNISSHREWRRCWYKTTELEHFHQNAARAAQRLLFDLPSTKNKGGFLFNCMQGRRLERNAQSRELLTQTFLECRNIKREQDVEPDALLDKNPIDRTALVELYQQRPNLVGLEAHLLSGLRGETAYLRNRILAFVEEKLAREEQRASADATAYLIRKSRKRALYAKTSQTISRPSRVYMHELAMAQSKASVY